MKFTESLKENRAFRRLYAKGRSLVSPCLVLYYRKGKQGRTRLGITVGSKLGKAVRRNRVRRRLREIYRTNEARLSPGYELVVVARVRAGAVSYAHLQRDFLSLAKKAGIVREDGP